MRILPRLVPPVAPPLSWNGLLAAARPGPSASAEAGLASVLGAGSRWHFSSGRAALSFLFSRVAGSRPAPSRILLPAYTCPSVAAAAVRAGVRIVLCDVDPATLSLDRDQLARLLADAPPDVIVAPSLLGIPAELPFLEELCRGRGILLVDDAAQALGAATGGRPVGSFGAAGIFSAGRGKVVSTWQGGVLVCRDEALDQRIGEAYPRLAGQSAARSAAHLGLLLLAHLAQRPGLFWLPAALPGLQVGLTRYDPEFPIRRMGRWGRRLLAALVEESGRAAEGRGRNAAAWRLRLRELPVEEAGRASAGDPVWLRYGLLLPDRPIRERAVEALRRAGIFASELYPFALGDLPPVRPHLETAGPWPGAESLAGRLLVLPTHAHVRARDIERAARVLEEILRGVAR